MTVVDRSTLSYRMYIRDEFPVVCCKRTDLKSTPEMVTPWTRDTCLRYALSPRHLDRSSSLYQCNHFVGYPNLFLTPRG